MAELLPQVWEKDPAAGRRQLEDVRRLSRSALAEMRSLLLFKAGETFSRQKIVDTVKAISDRLGNDGYSFANINPVL